MNSTRSQPRGSQQLGSQQLRSLDNLLNQRYSGRLRQFGADPRTLGWDTREHQWMRFKTACRFLPASVGSVIDIGCGLADFLAFLSQLNPPWTPVYTGVDINPDLIDRCRQRFPHGRFLRANILVDPVDHLRACWGAMFGVLNFRLPDMDNDTFAQAMIAAAFARVEEGLVVDMLSSQLWPEYPPEDFVHYYSPAKMLEFALTLTPYVSLIHDYAPIPQREFMLVLRKQPCG